MPKIIWDDSFLTKVKEIDDQHKELVTLMNNFHKALLEGKGRDSIEPTLKFLEKYVVKHFADEERVMEKYDCPLKETNKRAHKDFIEKLNDFKRKKASAGFLSMDLFEFISQWVIQHIKNVDQKMAAYVK